MTSHGLTRRECLAATGAAAAWALSGTPARAAQEPRRGGLRIGMCDWSMGRPDISAFELAKEIGLDGLQVSVGKAPNDLFLRDPKLQQKYLAASKATGVAIASTAMGLLNQVPFMSEPKTALWTADCIEVTRNLGTNIMLLAFFGQGELKAENKEDMRRTTESLIELAPRAEKAGVVLGIETYLGPDAHLQILDAAKSSAVQVYYDVYNSHVTKGYDPVSDIKRFGVQRVCQVHLKEGRNYLGESGQIDWPAVAAALKEIGYQGWLILETQSPSGDVIKDTRRNIEYVRKTFAALG